MFEDESLYNTKIFGKTFHIRILAAIWTMFQKLSPPKKIQYFLLNFKKATIFHNYLIQLYSRISSIYFKQILINYQDINQYIYIYIHCIYPNNKFLSYQILKSKVFTRACVGIQLVHDKNLKHLSSLPQPLLRWCLME